MNNKKEINSNFAVVCFNYYEHQARNFTLEELLSLIPDGVFSESLRRKIYEKEIEDALKDSVEDCNKELEEEVQNLRLDNFSLMDRIRDLEEEKEEFKNTLSGVLVELSSYTETFTKVIKVLDKYKLKITEIRLDSK